MNGSCRLRIVHLIVGALAVLLIHLEAHAQSRLTYSRGQSVSPAYEGWWENEDGSFTMFFGYMNTNWEEELDVPIGPGNNIEPGGPDQGQPTHFYPRRNMFLFQIRVPRDFGDKELVWTLTTNGKTERAYARLKPDYLVDKQTIATEVGANGGIVNDELRWNARPIVRIEGEQQRSVRVGEPLPLVAWASDDGVPTGRRSRPVRPGQRHPAYTPPWQGAPANPSGLRLSWIVYRGEARHVTFTPEQMKTWQDTRVYGNSPWSPPYDMPPVPPEGKWVVHATFDRPGTYVLRAITSDGALFTSEDVAIRVSP